MNKELKRQMTCSQFVGMMDIKLATYANNGALNVRIVAVDGEPIGTLSVNMQSSHELPPDCFYMKDWAENLQLAVDAVQSGWFKIRYDLPIAISGYVWADAYEVLDEKLTQQDIDEMLEGM